MKILKYKGIRYSIAEPYKISGKTSIVSTYIVNVYIGGTIFKYESPYKEEVIALAKSAIDQFNKIKGIK